MCRGSNTNNPRLNGKKMRVVGLRPCRLVSTLISMSSILFVCCSIHSPTPDRDKETTTEVFAREVERSLPREETYGYHRRLEEGPVHVARRDPEARPRSREMELPDKGWKLVWNQCSSTVLQNAVRDFQDYLD